MVKNRIILTAAAVSAIGLLSAAGVASADSGNSTLVDRMAQRFNLNKSDVQKVFDEEHQSRQADREKRYEERLTQAVKDGKLTEEQKTKILAKHKELVQQMEQEHKEIHQSLDGKTDADKQALMEQRHTEMEKRRSEIEAWEKQNNIPAGYLLGGPGGSGGHGRMMHGPGGM